MTMKAQDENEKLDPDVTEANLALDNKNTEPANEDEEFEFEEPYDAVTDNEKLVNKSNVKGFIYDLIFYALLIFVCIYVLPNYVIQRTIVDGTSMANTLHDGDQLYVEKLSYRFEQLDRFDIIVFYPYGRESKEYYVKRIIGLPGETVQIIGSDIYINGKILEEHYGKEPIEDPGRAAQPIKLGKDQYFVMGDNRNVSKDSRDPSVGNVEQKNIGGKVFIRISPLSKFGLID